MKIKCIDVSEWQGNVDFNKVKADGCDYVILRAGFGRSPQQADSAFETNYKNAKAAGLKVGAYWYSYAEDKDDAVKEAKACLEVLKGKTMELPVFYDMEENFQTAFGKTMLTEMAKAFMNTVLKDGFRVGIYANLNWFTNFLDYPKLYKTYYIWLAQYNTEPQLQCHMWQYSSKGKVKGVSGNTDMNIVYSENLLGIKTTENKNTQSTEKIQAKESVNLEVAGVQALLRQAYAQKIVKTFVKPIDNKKGKLTNAAIVEAKKYLGYKNPDTKVNLSFIKKLEHEVNLKRISGGNK